MISQIFKKLIGSRNDRIIKNMRKTVRLINSFEPALEALNDEALQAKTIEFRTRLGQGETLDALLPEAFAVVREASKRVMKMRHYDVQMIGGMVLHEGKIAEMRTGEGKTLVATLPVYLNALTGKGVHVVTVNDYLARRDAEWMGRLYRFLGLTVGVVVPGQEHDEKKAAYNCDISYCTNNELGFDYLRDNMSASLDQKVQRPLYFAVVDEVDSILIDEARTPLIISGPAEESSELYIRINKLVPKLKKQEAEDAEGDFFVNEKDRAVVLSEVGHERAEQLLVGDGLLKEGESLYDSHNLKLFHHFDCCLRAHHLFQKDVAYIVKNDEVVIVDEFTGRTLAGRRWSDGLHQAIEAKEGVNIQAENQTLASITFQNYFRIYNKLAGMTGTADTEAPEFLEIYGLEVVVIPTNQAPKRKDFGDLVFLTQKEKYNAIVEDIKDCHGRGQPSLVGTTSIEVSELISGLLKKEGIAHEVLNAKQHEREAYIVANAGQPQAVTIATNMAGRGTDIVLGGNFEMELAALAQEPSEEQKDTLKQAWKARQEVVLAAGGLHIIGTERHESRRIDNQLRGRAGRQGDVGSSRFYLSLEDHLMRIFTNPKTYNMMKRLGMGDGEAIEHKWISRTIENAQRKVEGHNFDIRKNLLQYDNVANEQRKFIYSQRDDVLKAENVYPVILDLRKAVFAERVAKYIPENSLVGQWDIKGLEDSLANEFVIKADIQAWLKENEDLDVQDIVDKIAALDSVSYEARTAMVDSKYIREFEKSVLIQTIDSEWKEHLAAMDYLRQGIQLRAYAQKKPEQEYKREAFEMFEAMMGQIHIRTVSILSRLQIQPAPETSNSEGNYVYQHPEVSASGDHVEELKPLTEEAMARVGRNDPCPCGSGKKFKACHGQLT